MSIRRSPSPLRKNFTVLSNATLEDKRLSWEAKGLLAYLLSKPDDWHVNVKHHLVKESPSAKKDKVYTLLNELRKFGYADVEKVRDSGGEFSGTTWIIYDFDRFTVSGFTVSGDTVSGQTVSDESVRIVRTEEYQELIETRTDFDTSTSPLQGDEKKAAEQKPFIAEFEQLWAIYPRRIAKKVAYEKVVARLRSGVKLETLLSATIAYAEIREGEDASFTLHPSTFYGSSLRYEDYLEGGTALVESRQPKPNGAYSDIEAFLQRGE